ncbi:MAG: restriction endonuclease subunit S [Acidobacteria bacterium]|nr:restriction endonuclease subunit S [Acidobacteriota bacterium]
MSFQGGGTPDKGNPDFWTGGTIPWVSPKDMKVDRIADSEDHITEAAVDGSATHLLPTGSVLVVVRGMILAHTLPVAVTTGPVTINQDIKALVCGPRILPEFLHAVLAGQSGWLLSLADSSAHGTKKLETEVLRRLEVPCPPLEVQRGILATLQVRASNLDELSASKQRVLGLIAEKRKAIVATGVIRGVDPKAQLHYSGLPWLGEIPTRWSVRKLARLFRERDERGEPDLPLLAVSINAGVVEREFSDDRIESTAADFNTYKVARTGDVVFNKMRMWQGAVGVAPSDGLVSPDYVVAVPTGALRSEYAGMLFRTSQFSAECGRHSYGIVWDRLRLYWEGFRSIAVPVPPEQEQERIIDNITRETAQIDAVRAATERTIALLKERRAALVAAAVTGQLDTSQALHEDSDAVPRTVIRQRTA